MTKNKARCPKTIDAEGEHDSGFHLMIMFDLVRLQVNASDVFYTKDLRTLRKMAKFFDKAADYLRDNK